MDIKVEISVNIIAAGNCRSFGIKGHNEKTKKMSNLLFLWFTQQDSRIVCYLLVKRYDELNNEDESFLSNRDI